MDPLEQVIAKEAARIKACGVLESLVNMCQWGSGFTASEIKALIVKETPAIKTLLTTAR